MTLNLLFMLAVALFIIAMIKQVLETGAFLNRLRDAHPARFESMGRPRWNIQFGDKRFRDAVKYIRSKQFTELNDPELERIYQAIKRTDRLAIIAAIAAVGVTIAEVVILGLH